MASKTVVILSDDLDGSEASETIRFALDNSEYEIDLNEGHANELRQALERFTNAGRRLSGGRGGRASASSRKTSSQGGPDAKAIRQWAAQNGISVNTRGRIQAEVVEKYEAAH
ncbi:Lsr2 family protein [Arthrobacter sp. OV608]|uniref:histone-like nucleoid-structuring protein Lsr2 n=1 Tax=Arthrobacter sp. OV608 TaxID=1882768 RepID=UPI0008D6F5B9|nr:Lsr2 family protein [Arthrobacter sp. OV608]SEQ81153.1 Lsr2 protein [Arthrobacter sp. OV608]